tara:strand:+ start:5605 stop:7464 length:1860 start_codon:yes stop_codon:yes gene_type:complete
VAQSNVKLTVDGSQATRALGQVQKRTQSLTSSVNVLRNAFLGIGATAVISQAVKQATSFSKLDLRLKVLTKATGTYKKSLQLVEQAQDKFGLSQNEALEGVTGLQARLAPLGATMEDISATFNGFNTAAILSGASTQEQAGAMRQLTQALGSGVLRGDEFNSIAEQMSVIQKPIADELGINVGQLRAFAAQGKITAPVVIRALKKIEKDGGKSLKELMAKDPTMVFQLLRNETQELSKAFGDLFAPAVLEGTKALTALVEATTAFIETPLGNTVVIMAALAVAAKGVVVVGGLLAAAAGTLATKLSMVGISSVAATLGLGKASVVALLASKSFTALTVGVGALKLAFASIPFVGIALAIGGITTAIIKQITERKKLKDLIEEGTTEEVKASLDKLKLKKKELDKQLELAKAGKLGLLISEDSIKKQMSKNLLTQGELMERLKVTTEIDKQNKLLEDQKEIAKELKDAYKKIGDSIATNIRDSLVEAIKGTKSLGDIAKNIIDDLADAFLRLAITQGLKATGNPLFSNLGFANGGRPPVGKASVVGERGPELFVPRQAGTIIPNDQLGSSTTNVVVNVDASGSEVQGDEGQAAILGRAISTAVTEEIARQKRPGGLLSPA